MTPAAPAVGEAAPSQAALWEAQQLGSGGPQLGRVVKIPVAPDSGWAA